MPSPLPNLVWLRTFEAAARLQNFTLAGKELGLTQTAVSLHVRSLEAALKRPLFLRRARHLQLSSEGEAYLLSVSQALGDIRAATAHLFGMAEQQLITVRAPISTATLWLPHHLPDFQAQYPSIRVRLVSTIWTSSAADDDIDVDLRLGRSEEYDGPSEVISSETVVPIAHRDREGAIDGPQDLADQPIIHILGYDDTWRRYFADAGLDLPDAAPAYSVDTSVAALALVAANAGCAAILTRFARRAMEVNARIGVVGDPIPFSQAHYLVRPTNQRLHRPEVELFEDWLKRKFSEEEAPDA
ncbi:MAG: LysR substrate-binding domain-containing protein [Pseudomonadota bacterium]